MAEKVRLIDAVALEHIIQEQVGKCMIKVFNPSVNLILQDIRNAPTIEAELDKIWISVKERLPKDNGIYMVWYKDEWDICEFDVESQTFGETYDEYDEMYSTFVCWDDSINKLVTHWMPLPEPPKGE